MTKKILLSFILLSFFKFQAQDTYKTTFGFKGGFNKSIVDGKEPDGHANRLHWL